MATVQISAELTTDTILEAIKQFNSAELEEAHGTTAYASRQKDNAASFTKRNRIAQKNQ
ncbi:MAG: hypothetical protein M5U34_35640 [Chloroflexi bacterium]|nr:hypothetical protein [Chloroflexota bacterium]